MKNSLLAFCIFTLSLFSLKGYAQYANGTGTGHHQNQIFWLQWDVAKLLEYPAGFTSTNIVEGTYVWNLESNLVRVVGVISNISVLEAPGTGTLTLTPYNTGTYVGRGVNLGDGLQLMYPGVNPVGIATKNSITNASYNSGVVKFDISLKLQMLIDGVWKDLTFPGIVVADAESMASADGGTEYISAETNGNTAWQILDVRNNAASVNKDPLKYKLEIRNQGKYFKLYTDLIANMGVQAVMFAEGTSTLTNIQMKGEGVTALALGFVAPFDYGDAPASYGEVPHYIDKLTLNGTPMTVDGVYSLTSQNVATEIIPTASIYINEQPTADGGKNHFSEGASIDEATTIPDYNGSGTYSLNVPIVNNTGLPSNIAAWIDWNQNGVFDPAEAIYQTNDASLTNGTVSLTWTGLPVSPDTSAKYNVRVRISTDVLTSPNLGATNGEVEDYLLNVAAAISGNVFHDANGLTNGLVDGTGTNLGGALYVNLVNEAGIVVASTKVASNGTYAFSGVPTGNYTLQLSTIKGVVTSLAPAVALPQTWVSTGEVLERLSGDDGIADGIIALNYTVGDEITIANFGIEQTPVNQDKTYEILTPALNTSIVLDGTGLVPGALVGSDSEDGELSSSKIVMITNLGAMNGNELYYNGNIVTEGTQITNYNPALLSIKFTTVGSSSVGFDYSFADEAGKTGTPGSYVINWQSALPVTLIRFDVKQEGEAIQFNWQTASEVGSDYFIIQHSVDGKSWADLGSVKALGNNDGLKQYSYTVPTPLYVVNLFRLKMVDLDGSYSYSRIEDFISSAQTDVSVSVFPNPVSHTLSVKDNIGGLIKSVAIYNTKGQNLYQSHVGGPQNINVSQLQTGIYIVQVIQKNGSVSQHKIYVNH